MPHSPGKFCIDRNLVRWSLINGVITRKTLNDGPLDGQDLPVQQITGIEKTFVTKVERQPYGRRMMLLGVALVALAWPSPNLWVRIAAGLAGLGLLYWGVERSRVRKSVHEAFQMVVPGRKAEDWLMVGSTSEILGFIDAVQADRMAGSSSHNPT